jgi:hypothetical protein
MTININQILDSLTSGCNWNCNGTTIDDIDWATSNTVPKPKESEIQAELIRLEKEFSDNEYARNRASEYPSLLELTVALYDTDDKSAVEAKRAAVKLKYPKPE